MYQYLTSQNYDVFFDYTHIPSGDFEQIIVSNIKARTHFVLILTPTALDRTSNEGDWLRREIETAIDEKRNIVPLFFDGFSFGSPNVAEKLTGRLADVKRYNGLDIPSGYFPEAMERLRTRYLNVPLNSVIHPVSTQVRKKIKEEKVAANKALREQRSEIKELVKPAEEKSDKRERPSFKELSTPIFSGWKNATEGFSSWFKKTNLRPFGIGIGILLISGLGIFGVNSLIQNIGERNNSSPTQTNVAVAITAPTLTFTETLTAVSIPTSTPLRTFAYTVRSGETCGGIAVLFGVSVQSIISLNQIPESCILSVGQVLKIPYPTATPVQPIPTNATTMLPFTPTPELSIGSTMTGVDGMTLLYVPAGEFMMGSEDGDDDEKPVHTVYLDAFWIDQTEVTNAMYAKCVHDGKCDEPTETGLLSNSKYANYPVNFVSWDNASAYCSWAGRRLPTEAEWEKAARGENAFIYPWGNDVPNNNILNLDEIVFFSTVGKYPMGASPYGALDMAGNAVEWVEDWYDSGYYQNSPSFNPPGPSFGQKRVVRGFGIQDTTVPPSADRGAADPSSTEYFVGFRCDMDAE
ncbi:MAG TPA: SUMF1/EgtB/PvdO family nonheme iron enzyme [Anaerolineales bacterium]|nr:SUMF1/EgtB/PvdO family nonheme iron enzyme [Anaerolineales bacterium]